MTRGAVNRIEPEEVFPAGAGLGPFTVLDVRAPVEVARGALPQSVNIPILSDEERRRVGIAYKESGQEAALALGYELTAASMPNRVAAWRKVAANEPAVFSCWRGGMRSKLAHEFLGNPEVGVVEGGYKALRAYLLRSLRETLPAREVLILAGMTGTGKTDLLESLEESPDLMPLDLEGLAAHRGSSFGANGEQPSQQSFENSLAARISLSRATRLLVEDESRRIGGLGVPDPLFRRIVEGPVLVLEAGWEERVQRIHRQYVLARALVDGPLQALAQLEQATLRLRRRLGTRLVEELVTVLRTAFDGEGWRRADALEPFISPLLSEYYDPLYHRSMEKLRREVAVRGDREEIVAWLRRTAQ